MYVLCTKNIDLDFKALLQIEIAGAQWRKNQ